MVKKPRLYDLGFVQTLFEDEEAGASAARAEALEAAKQQQQEEQGCNSIDIFLGPDSGPESGLSYVWIFETCLNM